MAITTGKVRCLHIADIFGFTQIEEDTGGLELFILWVLPGTPGGIPGNLTAFTRVLHSMWVSQLRDAHANNLTVEIVHGNDSTVIEGVRLGTF